MPPIPALNISGRMAAMACFFSHHSSEGHYTGWKKAISAASGTDSVQIRNMELVPVLELGADTTICEGDTLNLDATFSEATYLWQDGFEGPIYQASQAGLYQVQLTTLCGEHSTAREIQLQPPPILDLGGDTILCEGEMLSYDLSHLGSRFLWSDGSPLPIQELNEAGTFWVEVANDCASSSDTLSLQLENCDCPLYLPNAFTPNHDGTMMNT